MIITLNIYNSFIELLKNLPYLTRGQYSNLFRHLLKSQSSKIHYLALYHIIRNSRNPSTSNAHAIILGSQSFKSLTNETSKLHFSNMSAVHFQRLTKSVLGTSLLLL